MARISNETVVGEDMLILGLGNPLRGDDSAGYETVRRLGAFASNSDVVALPLCTAPHRLPEIISNHEKLIVVDALRTYDRPAGSVLWIELDQLRQESRQISPAHRMSLWEAMGVFEGWGEAMPEDIRLLVITIQENIEWTEERTPEVEAAVEKACDEIKRLLVGNDDH